jgi:hypothetical protein
MKKTISVKNFNHKGEEGKGCFNQLKKIPELMLEHQIFDMIFNILLSFLSAAIMLLQYLFRLKKSCQYMKYFFLSF